MRHLICTAVIATAGLSGAALATPAAFVEGIVTGLSTDEGVLACTLHDNAQGFPAAPGVAHVRIAPQGGQGICRFDGLPPGRYAVAVLHDENANGRLDTNALGIPQERWGISVGKAPRWRAPRFDEAAFDLGTTSLRTGIDLNP